MKITKRSIAPLLMLGAILTSMLLFPFAVSAAANTMTVVSDTTVQVTAGNVPAATYPGNAVLAWVHPNWWSSLTGHTFASDAKWIWESERVQNPVAGDIVEFKKEFFIPGIPLDGTMYITCDNGYELKINGNLIGSAQLGADWRTSDLTEDFVNSSGWQSVENWMISSSVLVAGENTIEISAANEQMNGGNVDSNPAGLIFEMQVSYEEEGGGGGGGGGTSVEVGGTVYPANKIGILVPWIFLTVMLTSGVVIAFKRSRIQS